MGWGLGGGGVKGPTCCSFGLGGVPDASSGVSLPHLGCSPDLLCHHVVTQGLWRGRQSPQAFVHLLHTC